MKILKFLALIVLLFSAPSVAISAETPPKGLSLFAANIRGDSISPIYVAQHDVSQSMQGHMQHMKKAPGKSTLEPAEGASVKILSPKEGQAIKGDRIPIQFKLVKGKRGEHVHAYIDGELMGMFKSEKGTLTGVSPGAHMLELRVATKDHQVELDAVDRIHFMVK